jgi:general secretion pathway protein M
MVYVSYAPPSREATLDARRRLLAQCPRLIEELAEVTTNLERQTQRLLPGGTAALAASELQRIVKEVAAAANVDVRSERVLPPIELTGLQEVPIELTVAGSIRDPVELLSKIEQTSRLLAVKDRKVPVVAVDQPREVLTTLTVAGYLLPASGNNP